MSSPEGTAAERPPVVPRRRPDSARRRLAFVLKIMSRCNLNCTYCYVYNKGDTTWRSRPALMDDAIVDAALDRIEEWCEAAGQTTTNVTFHGGEPLMVGPGRFDRWCRRIRDRLRGVTSVRFNLQTNAILVDDTWADLFLEHRVAVGVSIDGPAAVNDAARVDHLGRGSHARVVRGIEVLHRHGVPTGALAVVQFGEDGVAVHRHLRALGFPKANYLLPDFTYETVEAVRARFGPTPCADYLVPIFDEWWENGTIDFEIPLFMAVARLVLGGRSDIDMVGNEPFGFVFIEPDGAIEDLDALRVCRNGMAGTGLNVVTHPISDVALLSSMHRAAMFDGLKRPTGCGACVERDTCSGGYLPHRWSAARQFDNPSVWCADLKILFAHVRRRLGVDPEETRLRRQCLDEIGRLQ